MTKISRRGGKNSSRGNRMGGRYRVGLSALTKREWEVLALIVEGKHNAEIAEQLCLSVLTVQNHLHSIFRKLGVKSRTEAAVYVLRHGLLQKK